MKNTIKKIKNNYICNIIKLIETPKLNKKRILKFEFKNGENIKCKVVTKNKQVIFVQTKTNPSKTEKIITRCNYNVCGINNIIYLLNSCLEKIYNDDNCALINLLRDDFN